MALIDVQATFSDEQVVTATAVGSNFYDTGTILRNIGRIGQRIRFTVDEAATAAGAATVTFEVISADASDGTGNVTVLASSGAIGKAALTLGAAPFDIPIPDTNQEFVGVRYTIGTGPLTAGKFTATVVGEGGSEHQRSYPSGYPSPY
jgi:hypothetical protein